MNIFTLLVDKLLKFLPNNAFVRNISILVGGTASSQLIIVLASPLLTRLYAPEDFGVLAVYSSILAFFTVIASLRYELAIPLPAAEDTDEALDLLKICFISLFIISFFSLIFVFIMAEYLSDITSYPQLQYFLWALPIGIIPIGAYKILNYWALREKNYSLIAKTKLIQSFSSIAFQLSFYRLGAVSLIVGSIIGQTFGFKSLLKPVLKKENMSLSNIRRTFATARKYKKFPLYSTWEGFLNIAGSQLPPLLFAIFFSPAAAGLYALSHRVLALPMTVVGGAIGNVFLSDAATSHRRGNLSNLFENIYKNLTSIVMPVMLILLLDAPKVFSIIFGANWIEAGEIARWMSPWLAVTFIASPLSTLFSILDKQKQGMYFQLLLLISRIVGLSIGYFLGSMITAVLFFSLLSMCCWIGFLLWACAVTESDYRAMTIHSLNEIFKACCIVTPIVISKVLNFDLVLWLFSLCTTAVFLGIHYFKTLKEIY